MPREIMIVNPRNRDKQELHKFAEKKLGKKIPRTEFYNALDCFFKQHGRYPEKSDFSICELNTSKKVNVVVPVGSATAIEYKVDKRSRKHRKGYDVTYRHKMKNSQLVMDCVKKNKNQFYIVGDLVLDNDGWLNDK